MRGLREAGAGAAGPESWREAGRALRERARLAWALGAALDEALASEAPCGEGGISRLEAIVARALAGPGASEERVAQPSGENGQGGAGHVRRQPTPISDAQTAWRQMQAADLAGKSMPVVWFASAGAGGGGAASRPTLCGGERATLALGVAADGGKQVLGVWAGGAAEHRCSEHVASDLRSRGLGRGSAWVAVTGGERALGLALRQHWPNRVVAVAHCQQRVAAEVLGHLPTSMRPQVGEGLPRAWEATDAVSAQRELEAMVSVWQEAHPGGAARLRAEVEPTTVIQTLGVRGAVAERLRTAVPARYLLEQCLSAARGRSGQAWVAAIAAEARRRQAGFRRLAEHADLESLVRALAGYRAAQARG